MIMIVGRGWRHFSVAGYGYPLPCWRCRGWADRSLAHTCCGLRDNVSKVQGDSRNARAAPASCQDKPWQWPHGAPSSRHRDERQGEQRLINSTRGCTCMGRDWVAHSKATCTSPLTPGAYRLENCVVTVLISQSVHNHRYSVRRLNENTTSLLLIYVLTAAGIL